MLILEDQTNNDNRIECGSCHSIYSPRKFLNGKLNYECPVCEQREQISNESVKVDSRKMLLD